jgi:hypothetical protein
MTAHDDDALVAHDDEVGDELAEREQWPRPVSCAVRVISRNAGHVHVAVWAGRNEGARGNAGTLTFRTDEWFELVDAAGGIDSSGRLVLRFDVLPEPETKEEMK